MTKYRKTALIEATQWHKVGDHPAVVSHLAHDGLGWCPTLEGGHVVTPGDWIATGVKGEHWPIKHDVFRATYEPVEDAPVAEQQAKLGVETRRLVDVREVERLRELLRPFAEEYEAWSPENNDGHVFPDHHGIDMADVIMLGDLRAAYEAVYDETTP